MQKILFYCFVINQALECFEPIAVFNTKDEADHFFKTLPEPEQYYGKIVVRNNFQNIIDEAVKARLGDIAKVLEKAGLNLKSPNAKN